MKAKAKNIIFNTSAILLHLLYIFITYKLVLNGFKNAPPGKNTFVILFSILIVSAVVIITTGVLNAIFDSDDKYKFNISLYLINLRKNTKWVYHSKLGYFYCVIEPNKVILYQQGYFHRKKLEIFTTYGCNFTTDKLSIDIKNYLDFLYQRKLEIIKDNNDLNDTSKAIKDWDGFLDVVGKRDVKINKLLK
jgi:hypothetical protein